MQDAELALGANHEGAENGLKCPSPFEEPNPSRASVWPPNNMARLPVVRVIGVGACGEATGCRGASPPAALERATWLSGFLLECGGWGAALLLTWDCENCCEAGADWLEVVGGG
jgi:hypothetical protein